MKTFVLSGWLAALSCTAVFATPCVPGSLETFVSLGGTGCEVESVKFTDFTIVPGTTTPIDPAQVQVTPGGSALNLTLLFTLDRTANAGQSFESFFRFSVSGSLDGASIDLTSPKATGDGAVPGFSMCAPMARSLVVLRLAARPRRPA